MGTGGPGNIVHIDNLYPKTFPVGTNINIVLGEFVIFDDAIGGMRPLAIGDFSLDDTFLDLEANSVMQAGEDANNLTVTDVNLRKTEISCITKGSDWTVLMRAGVIPDKPVGILRVDADAPNLFQAANESVAAAIVATKERLGLYKHKEFTTVGNISAQDDDGIISTGLGIA